MQSSNVLHHCYILLWYYPEKERELKRGIIKGENKKQARRQKTVRERQIVLETKRKIRKRKIKKRKDKSKENKNIKWKNNKR